MILLAPVTSVLGQFDDTGRGAFDMNAIFNNNSGTQSNINNFNAENFANDGLRDRSQFQQSGSDGGGLLPPVDERAPDASDGGGLPPPVDGGSSSTLIDVGGEIPTGTGSTGITRSGSGQFNATGAAGGQAADNGEAVSQAQAEYDAIVSQYGECAISQILARGISNAIAKAITNTVRRGVEVSAAIISVPTSNIPLQDIAEQTRKEAELLRNKEVATGPTIPILGIPILPSWDALGYCIVNTMIEYISESTIRWINSGFQGNPVFIDNFGQFFRDLADIETATFLTELSAPDFLCEPYRIQIQTGLLQSYTDSYYQPEYRGRLGTGRVTGYGRCSFDEAQISLEAFVSGDPQSFQQGGWRSWQQLTQNRQNNIYGSYNLAQEQLNRRVQGRQGVADLEININDGFLSFRDEDDNVTTPGKIIQGQIENRLNIPENRLVLAREFDEVVGALVNQFVRVALNEVVGGINSALGN